MKEHTYYRVIIPCGTEMRHAIHILEMIEKQGWAAELESVTTYDKESEEE